jgi:hypothetical protein
MAPITLSYSCIPRAQKGWWAALALLVEFAHHVFGGEVELKLEGCEAIVASVYSTRWINALLSTVGLLTSRDTG